MILAGVIAFSVYQALSLLVATPASAADDVVCRFSDSRFTEISGMAPSIRHPDVLWIHNDSGSSRELNAVAGSEDVDHPQSYD